MENYKQKRLINKSILNILFYYLVSLLGAALISFILALIPSLKAQIAHGDMHLYMLLTNLLTYTLIILILVFINKDYLLNDSKTDRKSVV